MSTEKPWLDLYAAVGECLHAWGCVESDISQLFMVVHGVKWDHYNHPLRAAFEAAISLEVRLSMIAASFVADPAIDDEHQKVCIALCTKIKKSYRKRHEVAHFVLVGRGGTNIPQTHAIRPFFNWNDFTQNTGKSELNLQQIEDRKLSFFRLSGRIRKFVSDTGFVKGLNPDTYQKYLG